MSLLDIVFPPQCMQCGKSGKYVCTACLSKMSKAVNACYKCGKPSIDGMTHTKCTSPLALDSTTTIWKYEGVIRKAVLRMKYKFASDIAKELSKLTIMEVKKGFISFPKKAVLMPIPLHTRRLNWRGFNQVEEMGKLLARGVGWDYVDSVLFRKKLTTPQTQLKRKERLGNVRGVFGLSKNRAQLINRQTPIILFDDVFTTGSTLKEGGKVLKRASFEKVWGFTIAR